jgi:hypothetical protein
MTMPTSTLRAALMFSLACLSALTGCPADSKQASTDGGGPSPEAGTTCADDPLAETYMPGTKKTGSAGVLNFELTASEPGPPIKGNNTWTVKVTDASDNAIKDAELIATPFMPRHGHGTQVDPTVTQTGDGYTITPLYLYMRGVWQVTIDAKVGTKHDSAVFSYCID